MPHKAAGEAATAQQEASGDGRQQSRREQQRAKETRLTILNAALAEFAERGFDGASVRNIAERAQIQHPLITYHYRTKDVLWRAVAEHVWTTMAELWEAHAPASAELPPKERVRELVRQLFHLTILFPHFHHFMLRESRPNNPRLIWLAENFQRPLFERITAQIRLAQDAGDMPKADPTLVHYLMVGMVSVLSSLSEEIKVLSGLDATTQDVIDAYWDLIERVIFPTPFSR